MSPTPFAIIRCAFNDIPLPNIPQSQFLDFVSQYGRGGLHNYTPDASHNQIDLSGSEVFGWYTMKYSFIRDSVDPLKDGSQGRHAWTAEAIRLAGANGVDLSRFYGTIVVVNAFGVDGSTRGQNIVLQVSGPWGQSNWKWCKKCQGLAFAGNALPGRCPSGPGPFHDHTMSGDYTLSYNDPTFPGQGVWRWCNKCQGLGFVGNADLGPCPAGNKHDHTGSGDYRLGHGKVGFAGQNQWKWCKKCQGLLYGGTSNQGTCPEGGIHDFSASGDYTLVVNGSDLDGTPIALEPRNHPVLMPQKPDLRSDDRIFTFTASSSAISSTVTLASINRPEGSGYLKARVLMPNHVYAVEFHKPSGSDIGIGKDALLIHKSRSNITSGQAHWMWCNKCEGLTFAGDAICPAGSVHDHSQSGNYSLSDSSGQKDWKWCRKCQMLSFTGNGVIGPCPSGGTHDTSQSGNYGIHQYDNTPGQKDWKWCHKCQGLAFAGNPFQGNCSAGGFHDHAGSGNYALALGFSVGQDQWRWCSKCQGLAFDGYSVCAAGGAHTHVGSDNYSLALNDPSAPGQNKWTWCKKCYGLAFAGNPSLGPCPAGGDHDHSGSGDYTLQTGGGGRNGQNKWKWCNKCQLIAYSGNRDGPCPAGGLHDHTLSGDYTIPVAPADCTFLIEVGSQPGPAFTDAEKNVQITISAIDSAAGTVTVTLGSPSKWN